jgi:predicted phage gp36 major capsid-like protein
MDGTINASQENYGLIFGDMSQFCITDRLGLVTELVPHLFGSNRRPTGQRGWYCYYRTGSGVLVDGAFRLLDIT